MSLYSGPGYIQFNGVPCVKSAEIDYALATGNTTVLELLAGRAGHTKGAREYTITVTQSVPATGYEIDWYLAAELGEEVALDFIMPGVADKNFIGDIRDVKAGTKVNQTNTVNFTYHCARRGGS